jgi:hypothetical protein
LHLLHAIGNISNEKEDSFMDVKELNIQPDASIYGIFERLSYKMWNAVAEFVDNSTASFFKNEKILRFYKIYKCRVDIIYDDKSNTLIIQDDAYGMELADFERAILLDQKPNDTSGRNEFGMGLKTAASWFGKVWTVESTQYGSTNKYFAEVHIPKLKETKSNYVMIKKFEAAKEEHGTKIVISHLTKKAESGRTIGKIKDKIRSMFRRDINSGKVEIYFNGEPLKFEPYNTLIFDNQEWKKLLNFSFIFNDKQYSISGFVGILGDGSSGFGRAGFALFRRNRIVVGGEDDYYKPEGIFIQAQNPISHKLYGELDLDDFPVNQAKDGFIWDDGLELKFVEELKKNIIDYIAIAKKPIAQLRPAIEETTKEVAVNVSQEVNKSLNHLNSVNTGSAILSNESETVQRFEKGKDELKSSERIYKDTEHSYTIQINTFESIIITIIWTHIGDEYWFQREINNNGIWNVKVNINHPFFEPFYHNEDFKEVLEKFVISFLLASEYSSRTSDKNGYVLPSEFEYQMNKLLKILSNKRG